MATPTKLFLCVDNVIDSAVITGNPTLLSTLPASNLQIPSRGRVARTVGTAAQEIKLHWNGMGKYINFLILNRHNLETGATWRVQFYSDVNWTTQIYDSGTVVAYETDTLGDLDWGVDPLGSGVFDSFLGQKYSLVYCDADYLVLSVKITITNTSNTAGYLEASRLFSGKGIELAWNPSSIDFSWAEDTTLSRSDGGSLRSDGKISYRRFAATINWLDSLQRATMADMCRFAGQRKDIFVSMYPGEGGEKERDYTMVAKFSKSPQFNISSGIDTLSTQFEFEEA